MSVELFQIPFKLDSNETFLSYDDRLNHVILKNDSGGFGFVYLDDPTVKHQFSSDKQIRDAKFSPNLKFSAIQFSDLDIEIISFESGYRYVQSCKYKSSKGTMIIGFFWSHNENLLLVTNNSIELYQVSSDGICKLVKETKMKITNYVYSSKFGVLFLYSGGNTIQPYIFRQNSFDRIPKFTIDSQSPTLNMKNLFASKIHDRVYCIFGDDNSIHLYELNLETVYKVKTIKLVLPGPNSIHFVDNLIIVHSDLKISIVYDLKMIQKDDKDNKKGDEFPISANPMSLKLFDPNKSILNNNNNINNNNNSNNNIGEYDDDQQLQHNQERKLSQINNLYKSTWVYINPNYIYDSSNGNWYEVTLNYENISNFIQFDTHKIIPFLQDRTLSSAKDALLVLIKTIIEFKTDSLEGIGKIFDELNRVLFSTTNRNNTELLQRQILSNSTGGNSTNNAAAAAAGLNNSNNNVSPYSNDKKQLSSSTNSSPSIGSSRVKPTTDIIDDENDTFSLIGSTNNLNLNNTLTTTATTVTGNGYYTPNKNNNNSKLSLSMTPPQSPNSSNTPSPTSTATTAMMMKSANIKSRQTKYILIDSDDMYDKVFFQIYEKIIIETDKIELEEKTASPTATYDPILKKKKLQQITLDSKYLIAIVTEYIRSLNFNYCRISDKLYDLLISLFIDNNMFSQLHQFLQYHVITDSLNIAYKLLSIGEQYPPVLQLSLDMFKRLMKPNIIVTTLLEKGQVLAAIRLLRSIKETNPKLFQELLLPISPASFLKEANNQGNDTLFFFVFKYFESTTTPMKLSTSQGPAMDYYLKLFVEKFGEKSLSHFSKQQLSSSTSSPYTTTSTTLGYSGNSIITTTNNSLTNSTNSSLNIYISKTIKKV